MAEKPAERPARAQQPTPAADAPAEPEVIGGVEVYTEQMRQAQQAAQEAAAAESTPKD